MPWAAKALPEASLRETTAAEIAAILKEYGLTLSGGAQYGWGADGFMRMDIATRRSTLRQALEILETAYREKIAR